MIPRSFATLALLASSFVMLGKCQIATAQNATTPITADQSDAMIHRPARDARFPALRVDSRPPRTRSTSATGTQAAPNKTSETSSMSTPMVTVCSSLAVVLGLFAALVWITRKYANRSINGGQLPSEVVQSLGSTSIDPRTRLTMLRVGNRILVLSQTASSIQTLSEITDIEEVRHLTAACSGDSMHEFASTLAEVSREPAHGFTESLQQPATARKRGSLFATA